MSHTYLNYCKKSALFYIQGTVDVSFKVTISSKITAPELKNKKYSFNTSVILYPFIAFLGFIPLALTLSATKMYLPLFPLIKPIAQDLTPYLFPIYLFIINASEYMFGNFSYSY